MTVKLIDTNDDEGIFVVIGEGKQQAPMILETEGECSSYEAARERARQMPWLTRYCICRVVPVAGNELLALDMIRLQENEAAEDMPF